MKNKMKYPNVLILGTVPYDEQLTSRSFNSYFFGWPKENLQQIFSHDIVPQMGHCKKLLRITDKDIIKYRLNKINNLGTEFLYTDLTHMNLSNENTGTKNQENKIIDFFKGKLKGKHTPTRFLLRKMLWSSSIIRNNEISNWIKRFNPSLIFLSFTNDFFLLELAYYYSSLFNIPIVITIGDDYYFNEKSSLSPLYYYYRYKYKKLAKKVIERSSGQIYIGDKLKEKYNKEFSKSGRTIYLTSNLKQREFKKINIKNPKINYFGNIRLGRNKSLIEIANALEKIDNNYVLNVYSSESDENIINSFKGVNNLKFNGAIPYQEVQKKMIESDLLIIVEGYDKNNVQDVRYSVSTKIADSIASGCNLFAYGSRHTGALDYLSTYDICKTCTSKNLLEEKLKKIIFDEGIQRKYFQRSKEYSNKHHSFEKSLKETLEVIMESLNSSYFYEDNKKENHYEK